MMSIRFGFALVLVGAAAPLLAMGGGGGGSSAPSVSTPQYDPAVEYQKGIAALQIKDFKAAKAAFDHVLATAPKDANSNYLAGVARVGLNDLKGAKKAFERAAKLAPDSIRTARDLGVTYAKLGDKAKAEGVVSGLKSRFTACGTGCAQASDYAEAIQSISLAMTGKPSAALVPTEKLLFATASAGDAVYLAAVGLINEGRYDAAIAELKSAQNAFGPHPDILTYLGFANRKLGRFDLAESYYRQALAAAPRHRGAREYYGELMVERGDLAGAKQMLARLDSECRFGCAEAEELRRWIVAGHSPHS
jgi:tetratricopeptide (TPR) repeat protein